MMTDDIPNGRRRNVSEFLRCRNDNSLNIRCEYPIGIGDRPFRLEIYHITDTPDHVLDSQFTTDIHGKFVILNHLHAFDTDSSLLDYIKSLIHCEKTAFVMIDTHGYHDLIKHSQCPFQDIQMTCSKWIERSRK